MKNFTIISLISLVLFVPNLEAQTVAPLKIGNVWVYERLTTVARTTVVDTNVVVNTMPYDKLFIEVNYGSTGNAYARLREDGYYVLYNEFDSTETPYYKINAVIGDTWTVYPYVYTIADTFVANVFGVQTTIKFLTIDSGILLLHEYWTEKFGKLSSSQFPNPWLMEDLLGCVIDGIAYGDTSFILVSVEGEFDTQNNFNLTQNYPNPFNPATMIKYTIPERSFVTIKVYDALGNEISTLVNEEKLVGNYEVEFNASSLPSGTYFYQLKTENYIETKKMVLSK